MRESTISAWLLAVMRMINYQIWLLTMEYDGEEIPYQKIGETSSEELAEALLRATEETGYRAVIIRSR